MKAPPPIHPGADGVESAGKDIVNGVGDAAGDIADGVMGESRTDSTESATSR